MQASVTDPVVEIADGSRVGDTYRSRTCTDVDPDIQLIEGFLNLGSLTSALYSEWRRYHICPNATLLNKIERSLWRFYPLLGTGHDWERDYLMLEGMILEMRLDLSLDLRVYRDPSPHTVFYLC